MRYVKCFVLLGFVSLLGVFMICLAYARKDYVMVCKGGGEMKFVAGEDKYSTGAIYARGGSQPANPGPGECVWVDRGMRTEEMKPDRGIKIIVFGKYVRSGIGKDGSVEIKLKEVKYQKVDYEFENRDLQYLVDAIKNGKIFYLRAYRGEGPYYFYATKIGP